MTPLTADQAGPVLDERAPLLAPGLREQVLAEVEGNPLALVELAAALPGDAGGAGTAPLPVAKRVQEGPSGERWRAWPHAGVSCPSGGGRFG